MAREPGQQGSERPRWEVALTIRSDREPWPRSSAFGASQNSRDDKVKDPILGGLETTERMQSRSTRVNPKTQK